jgi:hypothetical protein
MYKFLDKVIYIGLNEEKYRSSLIDTGRIRKKKGNEKCDEIKLETWEKNDAWSTTHKIVRSSIFLVSDVLRARFSDRDSHYYTGTLLRRTRHFISIIFIVLVFSLFLSSATLPLRRVSLFFAYF